MTFDLEKLKTISVQRRTPQSATERRWARDMPAYYRLRMQGLQPPRVDGSAALEARGVDRFEIEYGKLATDGVERKAIREAIDRGIELQMEQD
jgi:hypothetical protein